MEIKGKFAEEMEKESKRILESKKIMNDLLNREIKRNLDVIKYFLGSLKNESLNDVTIGEIKATKKIIDELLESKWLNHAKDRIWRTKGNDT